MSFFDSFFIEENEGDANIFSVYRLLYQYAMRQEEIEFIRGEKRRFSKKILDFMDELFDENTCVNDEKKASVANECLYF